MAIRPKVKSKGNRTSQARRDVFAHSKVGCAGSSWRPDISAQRWTVRGVLHLQVACGPAPMASSTQKGE